MSLDSNRVRKVDMISIWYRKISKKFLLHGKRYNMMCKPCVGGH